MASTHVGSMEARDISKYCGFHHDHRHRMDECRHLKMVDRGLNLSRMAVEVCTKDRFTQTTAERQKESGARDRRYQGSHR